MEVLNLFLFIRYWVPINFMLIMNRKEAFIALKKSNSKTAPKDVALYLKDILADYDLDDSFLLHIAQHWSPRVIVWVIKQISNEIKRGDITIQSFPKYLNFKINRRKKRKIFRKTKYE